MVGYQLGMHNWCILKEDEQVELSHSVIFDETLYPGISTLDPAGLVDPSQLLSEGLDDNSLSTSTLPMAPIVDDSSSEVDVDIQNDLVPVPGTSKSSSDHKNQAENQPGRPRPGFDMVLQPVNQKAPNDINGDIDPGNITNTRRRAHLAILNEDFDFMVQCHLAGAQFFDQTSEAPKTYSQAMKRHDSGNWLEAVKAELSAMERLGVWVVVDIPVGEDLLNTVWIFRIKFDEYGKLSKYKARLCAAGNFQTEGINYAETYAPTGRPTALRALLSMGFASGLDVHQMDVKNAFLNGKLEETIYLRAPAGLSLPKGKCLRLVKSIYGLKQAPRVWHHELSAFFRSINFAPSTADPCLFISRQSGWQCWVHVYVDDMVIISKDVQRFKNLINSRYLMEDLGPLKHLLGMKIDRHASSINLSQGLYVDKILSSYGMNNCRTVCTPLVPNTRLVPATAEEEREFASLNINYRRAIGLLNYLSVSTRPDISFAMSQLSQFLEHPGVKHWNACVHLLRYLKGTSTVGLSLGSSISPVNIYTDADHANDITTSHSYFGYLTLMGSSLISWKAKKAATVSSSTTEAEYTALYEGGREAVWVRRLLNELSIKSDGPTRILCDNQAALALAKNTVFHDRTKHFRVHLHWIRERINEGEISTSYVSTSDNLSDFLTKSLCRVKHQRCIEGINLAG